MTQSPVYDLATGTTSLVDDVPLPAPVPQVVTPRQARLALEQEDLLDVVEGAVDAADKATQITWRFAAEVRRDDALLAEVAGGLGLTSDDIDDLFRLAETF
jgi:hypothetical protein